MISFENVSFAYGDTRTLSDVSFSVEKGEFIAVIGANGAGKTTLSKMVNGLNHPSVGRVVVNGMDTKTTKTSILARTVGFLFQNPDRQLCQNTVSEEIMFGLNLILEDKALIKKRHDDIIEDFKLEADKNPFSLSRGERQRVALASVLAAQPDILILDEPTTGLDYRECMGIMQTIDKLNQKGVTVIMVTHDMEIVQDFARRLLVMCEGRLIADGEMKAIMANESLLLSASLLPPQIKALALRMGEQFSGVFTIDEMLDRINEIGKGRIA